MTFKQAIDRVRDENVPPGELSQIRTFLAGEYGYLSSELNQILIRRSTKWFEFRSVSKSDKQADRMWEQSADGQKEMELRMKMKSMDKISSAIKTRLEVLTGEARNLY